MAQGFAGVAIIMATVATVKAIAATRGHSSHQEAAAVCPAAIELVDPQSRARIACTDELASIGCPEAAAGDRVDLAHAPHGVAGPGCRVQVDGMRAAWMLAWGYALDINRRSAQELATVPGVGLPLAERIVAHRARVGGFDRLEGLLAVRGVGPKSLDKLRPYLKVAHPPARF